MPALLPTDHHATITWLGCVVDQEDDIRFQSEGIDLVLAPEDVPLLDQAIMDFAEVEPGKPHFIFLNPKDPTYVPPSGN